MPAVAELPEVLAVPAVEGAPLVAAAATLFAWGVHVASFEYEPLSPSFAMAITRYTYVVAACRPAS